MKDWQLPLDALPGEIVSLHPGEGLTTAPWRSPRRNCGPGPGSRTVSEKPPAVSEKPPAHRRRPSPATWSHPATWSQPSYLKSAQLPEVSPATWSRLKPLPATRTSHYRWVWLPPQPGPLPANLQREDSLFSPPSEGRQPPQRAFRRKTASSACLSNQDLFQPSQNFRGKPSSRSFLSSASQSAAPREASLLPCSACNISSSCHSWSKFSHCQAAVQSRCSVLYFSFLINVSPVSVILLSV